MRPPKGCKAQSSTFFIPTAALVGRQLHNPRPCLPCPRLAVSNQRRAQTVTSQVVGYPHRFDERTAGTATRQAVQDGQLGAGNDAAVHLAHDQLVHRVPGDVVKCRQIGGRIGALAALSDGVVRQQGHDRGHILAGCVAQDHRVAATKAAIRA